MMKEDEMELNKMRDALSVIANEIQLYNNSSKINSCPNLTENEKIFKQMLKYKSLLSSKNKRIKKLQDNIKIACVVAKTMISTKENENVSLNTLLNITRGECFELYQKNRKTSQDVLKLSEQNKTLQNKLDTMRNFIEVGFKQIPNSSLDDNDETSKINKLKEIIIYSTKSSADYIAKHEKNLQFEHENRFLKQKIINLNTNNETLSKELNQLNYKNIKLQKEKFILHNILRKTKLIDSNCKSCSESWIYDHGSFNEPSIKEILHISTDHSLNLTVHLSIAKKLLLDQSELLQHLKYLTQEIITT